MKLKDHEIFIAGLLSLLLFNFLQAGSTELLDDEAYYWMYSQHPDWGYYDHPPMVAWMIGLGYSLIHNTSGVRLFFALSISICLWILYKLQQPINSIRLICIVLSLGVIQFGGFLAVPDVPLVLFSAIFIWLFRRYLFDKTRLNAIYLGICMAALLYSKYQGFLLIGFCLLANRKLFLERSFWLGILVCLLLLIPHISWQIRNGVPSLEYFLSEHYSDLSYHYWYTTDYLLGQIFFFGPLIGWMIFLSAVGMKPHGDIWIRTLQWIVCGVFAFFFLNSFFMHTEPNWTAIAIIPSILLLHNYLDHAPRLEKILYRLFPFSLMIIFFIRIAMIWNIVGDKVAINKELHDNEKWTGLIREKARAHPIYFVNSYQQASKYNYYQHEFATSYNGVGYRNNQYDIWKPQANWFQDSILVVSINGAHASADSIISPMGKIYCQMFVNPNFDGDESISKRLPPQKPLIPFLKGQR
ncbi:MAG: ArnT family glycosyltransferase [Chitinophagales bacterium]